MLLLGKATPSLERLQLLYWEIVLSFHLSRSSEFDCSKVFDSTGIMEFATV